MWTCSVFEEDLSIIFCSSSYTNGFYVIHEEDDVKGFYQILSSSAYSCALSQHTLNKLLCTTLFLSIIYIQGPRARGCLCWVVSALFVSSSTLPSLAAAVAVVQKIELPIQDINHTLCKWGRVRGSTSPRRMRRICWTILLRFCVG